ncbi:MAG TPA: RidA family protein [Candidatus Saccharimonadia bacterium]|nr:RidA family protein [Candidatus Saccharimonadia bacterium]
MQYFNTKEFPNFSFLTHASRDTRGGIKTAGFVGIIPDSDPPRLAETAGEQMTYAMGYAEAAVLAAGGELRRRTLGRVLIFHTQREDSGAITEAYVDYLNNAGVAPEERPPRAAIGASFLPMDALVEILVDAEVPGELAGNVPEESL